LDNTKKICDENGVVYINPNKALYNGEKINIAKKYLLDNKIEFNLLLYLESDEVIEPMDAPYVKDRIFDGMKKCKAKFMSFNLTQLWRNYTGLTLNYSCSKLIVATSFNFPVGDEGHNATYVINISFKNIIEGIRMYHLHMFRKKALQRVVNGIWRGGGDGGGVNIEKVKYKLEKTDFLNDIYNSLKIQDDSCPVKMNTYVGDMGE